MFHLGDIFDTFADKHENFFWNKLDILQYAICLHVKGYLATSESL